MIEALVWFNEHGFGTAVFIWISIWLWSRKRIHLDEMPTEFTITVLHRSENDE